MSGLGCQSDEAVRVAHIVTSPYTDCILIHEARTLVFMIIITE